MSAKGKNLILIKLQKVYKIINYLHEDSYSSWYFDIINAHLIGNQSFIRTPYKPLFKGRNN